MFGACTGNYSGKYSQKCFAVITIKEVLLFECGQSNSSFQWQHTRDQKPYCDEHTELVSHFRPWQELRLGL